MGLIIRTARLLCLLGSIVLVGSACGDQRQADPIHSVEVSGQALQGDFSGLGPGRLVAAKSLPSIDGELAAATSLAARITYVSKSGVDGNEPEVTAAVFVPKGTPRPGGWRIVAFGHPTTGIQPECAPSLSPSLLNSSTAVTALVRAGYVVTVSDYQGLGLRETNYQGIGLRKAHHPYLDSTTVGYNLIDSVRATRKLVPNTSQQWAALGVEQGGQAAWAANELDTDSGGGLNLIGTASLAPIADLAELADSAAAGRLTTMQQLMLIGYLAALKNEYPDFDLDAYRRGVVKDEWDVLLGCQASAVGERDHVARQISADDLRPGSPEALERLHGFMQKTTLPQGPTAAPMLVIYGGQDGLIPTASTHRALVQACRMGDVIQIEKVETRPDSDLSPALKWIADRFNGVAAPNDCPSLTATSQPSTEGR